MSPLPREVDDLYSGPPEDFIKARDLVVKELRESGREEEAAEVKKLKRPTLAAWAINQTVRRQPKQIEWLLEADEKVRSAKTRAVFKESSEARQDLVSRLVGAALSVLSESNNQATATVREKITNTLLAVALDDQARELVRTGRLEREISPGGFGPATPVQAIRDAPDDAKRKRDGRIQRLRDEARSLAEEARHLRREAARVTLEAKKMEKRAERIDLAAERAEEQAKAKLSQAEELL